MAAAVPCLILVTPQAPMWQRARAMPEGWLTTSEQARRSSMDAGRQREFLACRYALRLLLAGSPRSARAWRLAAPEGRPPLVANAPAPACIDAAAARLSVARSADWLACAAAGHSIGIDLMCGLPAATRQAPGVLAELACSRLEKAWLRALEPLDRLRHWARLCCLKEAYAKTVGGSVDFGRMRAMSWLPALPGVLPVARRGARRLAHGRSWCGVSALGDPVTLALCAHGPLADIRWRGLGGVTWAATLDWHLWETDQRSVPPGDVTTMECDLR